MKALEFKIEVNATADKVWASLWESGNYEKWTSVFCEGSYAVSDWKEGSKINFLSPGGEGMYSIIETLVPNKKMVFKHLGEIKNNVEMPLDDKSKLWSGAHEGYFLEENEGKTILTVKMDIVEDYADYFNEAFPKGLETVKNNAESQ